MDDTNPLSISLLNLNPDAYSYQIKQIKFFEQQFLTWQTCTNYVIIMIIVRMILITVMIM